MPHLQQIRDPLSHVGWHRVDWAVTVLANTCTEAGTLTTLASLKGAGAGRFLASVGARHWLQ